MNNPTSFIEQQEWLCILFLGPASQYVKGFGENVIRSGSKRRRKMSFDLTDVILGARDDKTVSV
jgi:hypothetical protein